MRISDWSSDVCSSDLRPKTAPGDQPPTPIRSCENKRRPMKLFVRPPRLSVGGPGASPGRRPTTAGHDIHAPASRRSDERRVGKECVRTGRNRGVPAHSTKKNKHKMTQK